MGSIRGDGHDLGTPTARAIRATAARWFVLLGVPWVILAVAIAARVSRSQLETAALAAAGSAAVIVIGLYGLNRLMRQVDRLDQERHGLREAYDQARLDSLRDGLTGLGNHRAFQEELGGQVSLSRSTGRPFALLYLDVDDLKRTNDLQGHTAGDELIRATGRLLTGNLRRGDRAFRIGGDEFAVLLLDCGPDEGLLVGRRILATALDGGKGALGAAPFSVTIGVSAFPTLAADRAQLIRQADAALYWGKRHGRTDVRVFDPARHGMAEDGRSLDELATAVSRVAAGGRLTPVYQPIYSMRTGAVVGYEGLVRPTADAGFANPSALFIAAETVGRTVELDRASLETVLAGSQGLGEREYLSVNLSPRSLEADAFSPHELLALARRHGIEPSRLVVELTEREAIEDMGRLRAAMDALRRQGVRTAADDVGSGNAGLRLLSELPFDVVKIDLTLVRAGAAGGSADAVLQALREMAVRRGQSIVAEGVETARELEVVMSLGIDAAQGYLLQRPAPGLDAAALDLEALAGGGSVPRPVLSVA